MARLGQHEISFGPSFELANVEFSKNPRAVHLIARSLCLKYSCQRFAHFAIDRAKTVSFSARLTKTTTLFFAKQTGCLFMRTTSSSVTSASLPSGQACRAFVFTTYGTAMRHIC